jgi:methylglutaconyl-CoA hydratase
VVAESSLDAAVDAYVRELMTSGPQAIKAAKALIAQVADRAPDAAGTITAEALAARRVSDEGQAGMRAFIEKRRAPWMPAE